ncbi:hypothetical protein GQ53DRAFT_840722 [Thozetella sp. PMI_491]|nr:hypothetical protein GQ53DRAFT_840722 [Thozetella sp. PMI_491]
MKGRKKTWFLAPSFDIPPLAIRLGHILADFTEPRFPINNAPDGIRIDEKDVLTTESKDFRMKLAGDSSVILGIWGQFLQVFGVNAEAKLSLESNFIEEYSFDEMRTEWFRPSASFLEQSVGAKDVTDFLGMAGRRKPLYMVVGLKTVLGGSITVRQGKSTSLGGNIGANVSPGVPVSIGPEAKRSSASALTVTHRAEKPIIFAYQLVRLALKGARPAATLVAKGMFDANKGNVEDIEVIEASDVSLESISKDGDASLSELENISIRDGFDEHDGQDCVVAIPG